MWKSIFYKEFIKTKVYYSIAAIVMLGFAIYCGLYVNRAGALVGMAKLWDYLLMKSDSMITLLKYLPLLVGIGGAVAQFAPEMYRKCLKLTLHLPYNHHQLVGATMLFGVSIIVVLSLLSFLILYLFLTGILPIEITSKILQTAIPWYLAGICGYLLTVWVVLQPVLKNRILQTFLSVFLIQLFFITDTPGAYCYSLWILIVVTLLSVLLSVISLNDFKEGRQD